MKGKILVTGGLGFIGSHIANALARNKKNNILVFDTQAKDGKTGNVLSVRGDISDLDKLVRVVRGQEVTEIIPMIGLASIPDCRKDPNASFRLNLLSVHNARGESHRLFTETENRQETLSASKLRWRSD